MSESKTILITGSSRGIGKAIAIEAYNNGYKVILHGKTDSEELDELNQKFKGSLKISFDISKREEVEKGIAEILQEVSKIDVLVNNAGVRTNPMSELSDLDTDKANEEWETNVLGTLYCTNMVLPKMIEEGKGSVVNIASIKGHYQLATMSSLTFSATKSAIISITKSLAKIYSDRGVRFNSVSPGYVATDQVDDWNKETFKRINEGTLLGRMANPEEIAPVVLFLASDESSYLTGEDILIDGGYKLKGK